MDQVRRAYRARAGEYTALFGATAAVHDDDLDLIARHLAGGSGPVLDVGCGPGHLTAHLRSLGVDATGIDPVPEFVDHARVAHPDGRYEVGAMPQLPVPDAAAAGVLAWYSLIHTPPDEIDAALAELRRAIEPGGTLVVGFFDGDEVEPFDHAVVMAWFWPVDELSVRLRAAGFTEIERQQRPAVAPGGPRAHAALAARAG